MPMMSNSALNRRPPWGGFLRVLIGILLPLLIVGYIAEEVFEKERFDLEAPLMQWVHAHSGPAMTSVSVFLHHFGGPAVMGPVLLLIPAWLFWKKQRPEALFALLGLGGSVALALAMKLSFNRPRPELWPRIVTEHGASFPSGHSTMAAALVTFLVLLLWQTRYRWTALVLGVLYALLVGYSRIVLGVHYPTDVLAGWLTGISVVIGAYSALRPHWRKSSGLTPQLEEVR